MSRPFSWNTKSVQKEKRSRENSALSAIYQTHVEPWLVRPNLFNDAAKGKLGQEASASTAAEESEET